MRDKDQLLILGATGDIGGELCKSLSREFSVLGLASRETPELKGSGFDYKVIGHISDGNEADLDFLADEGVDCVINAAGTRITGSELVSNEILYKSFESNLLLLSNFFDIIKGFINKGGMFINIGSIASFASSDEEWEYAFVKASADIWMRKQQLKYQGKIKFTNLRLGAVKSRMTADRANAARHISTEDLATLLVGIIESRRSIDVPVIDLFRGK
ncbi:NAD-dependent epimerase/dehydratase family protein [Pseudomonadales bacterium]|nr:NAD-dependent epimerase/dehydratase family protein [Pseudomonadales bacterium]